MGDDGRVGFARTLGYVVIGVLGFLAILFVARLLLRLLLVMP